jgi:hypothetical protein
VAASAACVLVDTIRYAAIVNPMAQQLSRNMHGLSCGLWDVVKQTTRDAGCVRVFAVGMDPQVLHPVRSVLECHVARHFVVDAGRTCQIGTPRVSCLFLAVFCTCTLLNYELKRVLF